MEKCAAILNSIEGIAVVRLNNRDVVRNRLVKDIVKAFEKAENEKKGLLLAVSRCVEKKNDLVKKCAVLKWRCTFYIPQIVKLIAAKNFETFFLY